MMKIDENTLAHITGGFCAVKNDYGAPVDVAEGLSATNPNPFTAARSHLQPGESMFVGSGRFAAGTDRVMSEGTCTGNESFSVARAGGWLNPNSPVLR